MEKDSGAFWHKGLSFSCTSCGHCCRHEPGYVFLSEKDLQKLASHMKMTEEEFIHKWCRIVNLGITSRISLIEKDNNDCIFWDNGCSVYKARPLQCSSYPFWSSLLASKAEWDREAGECPGMNTGRFHDKKEIQAFLEAREDELLINPAEFP